MLRSTSRLLRSNPENDYGKALAVQALPAVGSSADSWWLLRTCQGPYMSEMSRTRSEFGIPSLLNLLLPAPELRRRCSWLNIQPGWCSAQYDTPISLGP